jgi:anaerobic selenocysteine-containing dehydrogenase
MIERLPSLLESSLDNSGLRLVNRRLARRVNSASYARTDLAEREPPDIVIHPSDAADLGIEDGASIRVRSEVGSIEGRANLDDKIRRGAVSLTHGWISTNVNELISANGVDPLTGQPQMSGILVTVELAQPLAVSNEE